MLRLAVRFEDKVRQFAVPKTAARLGSSTENELHAPFPGVSKLHLEVSPHAEGVHLRDLGSKNGLVSEGRRVDELLLRAGQSVFVGRAALVLEDLPSSDAEVAFALTGASHALRRESASRATDRRSGTGEDGTSISPAAALRLVRELEGAKLPARGRAGLLRRCAEALGCETLLVLDRDPELAIEACHGQYPSEEFLESLSKLFADRRDPAGRLEHALVGRGGDDGERALVARFAATRSEPEPWQREFFDYLADRLLERRAPAVAEPSTASASEGEILQFPPGMMVGASPALQGLLTHMRATIRSEMNVLLVGETGTGKELFARLIHASGPKSRGPFVAINCAAIPSELLEAELFGVTARVATGVDPRPGLFVLAQGGTVFLDEIGDMPERLQAKMLRVLQEHEVLPLGGSTAKKVDARVVAASNRDLAKLVQEGAFRVDLFYRLRGLQFHIPPLRERREDLPELILGFASRSAEKYRKQITGITRHALALLLDHPWPGNVRELENELERAVLLCADGGVLGRGEFAGIHRHWDGVHSATAKSEGIFTQSSKTLASQVDDLERATIRRALADTGGNKSRAAKLLGLTRNGLALKIRRLNI